LGSISGWVDKTQLGLLVDGLKGSTMIRSTRTTNYTTLRKRVFGIDWRTLRTRNSSMSMADVDSWSAIRRGW